MYIGKTPITGNFVKLDSISVVNGQAAYTMNNGGSAFTNYNNVNQFLVSLNGILQSPTTSFTVSGSTLTFASNLATGDVIDFIIVLGNTLDVGVPSDNTVSTAKIVDSAITSAKLASGVGGKVLQVVSSTTTAGHDTNSTSYTAVTGTGNSVSITPSATSSKVLIMTTFDLRNANSGANAQATIFRDSTDVTGGSVLGFVGGDVATNLTLNFLDSPNTTSQVTYKVAHKSSSSSFNSRFNSSNRTATYIAMEIGA